MDYAKELEKYPDAAPEEKMELEKLAVMQKDIAIGGSAEDFIRHPFFKTFENHMNDVINDTKGAILKVTTIEDLKSHQAAITAISELKKWLNTKVIAGRVAKQTIDQYEQDTDKINEKIQEVVDKANQQ